MGEMLTAFSEGQVWQNSKGSRVTIIKIELNDSWYGGIVTLQHASRRSRCEVRGFQQRYKPVSEPA